MTEYINKQKLIKSIEDKRPLNWNDTEAELAEQRAYDDIIELIKDFNDDESDRINELAEADKEGVCLVLPCKVGDTYYTIQKTCSDGGYAKKGEYFPCESDCEYCDIRDCDKEFIIREHKFNSLNFIVDYMEYIGEFLFLTKEEAEKALEGLE